MHLYSEVNLSQWSFAKQYKLPVEELLVHEDSNLLEHLFGRHLITFILVGKAYEVA